MGQGLKQTGRIADDAIERTVNAITLMRSEASSLLPYRLVIAATSAARDAANAAELSARLEEVAGVGLTVIPWEEEARYSLVGAGLVVAADRFVLFDIGGGSTEYVRADHGAVAGSYGSDLGVVRLAETYLTRHPVDRAEYARMGEEIVATVDRAVSALGADGTETLVGTAGTVTSLAAIDAGLADYDPDRINGYILTADRIGAVRDRLFAMSLAERGTVPFLGGGREDLVIPGIAIIEATMARLGVDRLTVADYGLREGLVVAMMEGRV